MIDRTQKQSDRQVQPKAAFRNRVAAAKKSNMYAPSAQPGLKSAGHATRKAIIRRSAGLDVSTSLKHLEPAANRDFGGLSRPPQLQPGRLQSLFKVSQ